MDKGESGQRSEILKEIDNLQIAGEEEHSGRQILYRQL